MSPRKREKGKSWAAPRRSARYPHLRELSLIYEGHSESIPVRPPDISPQGMFINTTDRFPEGAVLKVRFLLTRSNVEVSTRAEVRYCLPGVGIGVEFLQIHPDAARAIEREVRTANHSRARRA